MGKFLTGKELEEAIYNIIWDAKETLLIVSPFIKLDDYFKKLFDHHLNNPKIHLIVVFGKNEKNVKKSLSKKDFDYFKQFPNVSIIYVPQLHAKYYGNEKKGMISSINLYDYSFKNNIEFGVFREKSIMDTLSNTPASDVDAWNKCMEIANENEVVFIKRPIYEQKKFLVNLGKDYISSNNLFDSTDKFYGFKSKAQNSTKKLGDYPLVLDYKSFKGKRPEREEVEKIKEPLRKTVKAKTEQKENQSIGYCIRTGKEIPYNPSQPLSKESWRVWNQYGDYDFGEAYCHKTGKKSLGKTSMRNPILV